MPPDCPSLDAEAGILRRAVARGDFAGAEASARRYTSLVAPSLEGLAPAEAMQRLDQACRLIEWARRQVCASRVRVSEQIDRVQGVSQYRAALRPLVHTWKLDA